MIAQGEYTISVTRRSFLATTAVTINQLRAAPTPAKITRIEVSTIRGNFHKFVAMNSYDNAPKGTSYSNTLIRLFTDQDVAGSGVMTYGKPDTAFLQDLRNLIGVNPESLYEFRDGYIAGRAPKFSKLLEAHKHLDGPLCDLIGKLRDMPCWKLFGEAERERIDVYDGTLYFSDLWFRNRGVQAVVDEATEAVGKGYRGIKLKIGRGSKWMPRDSGLQRDIEVIQAVRSAVGKHVNILVDANNGYVGDFDASLTFINKTKLQQLYWFEEFFPESIEEYEKLSNYLQQEGITTWIADGENMRSAEQFLPYLTPKRLFDVLQLDIRTGGVIEGLKLARMAGEYNAHSVPHNWGSQLGFLMSLHLAKTQKHVIAAEDDRSTCPALVIKGYEFADGTYSVSNEPGLGAEINEDFYEAPEYPAKTVVQ